jgi:hypothetical protein
VLPAAIENCFEMIELVWADDQIQRWCRRYSCCLFLESRVDQIAGDMN